MESVFAPNTVWKDVTNNSINLPRQETKLYSYTFRELCNVYWYITEVLYWPLIQCEAWFMDFQFGFVSHNYINASTSQWPSDAPGHWSSAKHMLVVSCEGLVWNCSRGLHGSQANHSAFKFLNNTAPTLAVIYVCVMTELQHFKIK